MTLEEKARLAKTPFEAVVIRSSRLKLSADDKIKNVEVGDVINITHEFGDEAISLAKIVVKDSPEHKAWAAAEKKKAESRKNLAPAASVNELLAQLIATVKENTEAVTKALGKK